MKYVVFNLGLRVWIETEYFFSKTGFNRNILGYRYTKNHITVHSMEKE